MGSTCCKTPSPSDSHRSTSDCRRTSSLPRSASGGSHSTAGGKRQGSRPNKDSRPVSDGGAHRTIVEPNRTPLRNPLQSTDHIGVARKPRSALKSHEKSATGDWIVSSAQKRHHEVPTQSKMMISKQINATNFATVAERGLPSARPQVPRTPLRVNEYDAFQSPLQSLHLLGSPSVGNDHLVMIDVQDVPNSTGASPLNSASLVPESDFAPDVVRANALLAQTRNDIVDSNNVAVVSGQTPLAGMDPTTRKSSTHRTFTTTVSQSSVSVDKFPMSTGDAFGSRGQSMRLSRENSKSSYSSLQPSAHAPHSERHEGNPLE